MKTMSKRAWVLYVFIAAFLAGLIVLFYTFYQVRCRLRAALRMKPERCLRKQRTVSAFIAAIKP